MAFNCHWCGALCRTEHCSEGHGVLICVGCARVTCYPDNVPTFKCQFCDTSYVRLTTGEN